MPTKSVKGGAIIRRYKQSRKATPKKRVVPTKSGYFIGGAIKKTKKAITKRMEEANRSSTLKEQELTKEQRRYFLRLRSEGIPKGKALDLVHVEFNIRSPEVRKLKEKIQHLKAKIANEKNRKDSNKVATVNGSKK